MFWGRNRFSVISLTLILLSLLISFSFSNADTVDYIYDSTGRLSKIVTPQGDVKQFRYDKAGNLLGIEDTKIDPLPPIIHELSPDFIFLGQSKTITLRGSNLLTVKSITSDNPGFIIKGYSSTDTEVTLEVEVLSTAEVGLTSIKVKTVYGSTSTSIYILDLVLSKRVVTLSVGGSEGISISTIPGFYRDLTFQVTYTATSVINLPSTVVVPAFGQGVLQVEALSEGTDVVDIGELRRFSVYVSSGFTGDIYLTSSAVSILTERGESISGMASAVLSLDVSKGNSPSSIYSNPVSITGSGGLSPGVLITSSVSAAIESSTTSKLFGLTQISIGYSRGVVNGLSTSSLVSIKKVDGFKFGGSFFKAEAGTVEINHQWRRVDLLNTYTMPVVVAKPLSNKGTDPAVVRIRNVTPRSFEIRIQEWNYLDGKHTFEKVSYLVMEAGHYITAEDIPIEAGIVETSRTGAVVGNYETVSFKEPFDSVPVLITTVMSFNGGDTVTTRNRNITVTGFEVVLQEQESNKQAHYKEKIGYIAWGRGMGNIEGVRFLSEVAGGVNHNWKKVNFEGFSTTPVFIADMESTWGPNPANLRYSSLTNSSVLIRVSEEQSYDEEIYHAFEDVGIILLMSQ